MNILNQYLNFWCPITDDDHEDDSDDKESTEKIFEYNPQHDAQILGKNQKLIINYSRLIWLINYSINYSTWISWTNVCYSFIQQQKMILIIYLMNRKVMQICWWTTYSKMYKLKVYIIRYGKSVLVVIEKKLNHGVVQEIQNEVKTNFWILFCSKKYHLNCFLELPLNQTAIQLEYIELIIVLYNCIFSYRLRKHLWIWWKCYRGFKIQLTVECTNTW